MVPNGTQVSLVSLVPRAMGKRKTDSMRSKVTRGWLIGKKLGGISFILYLLFFFTSIGQCSVSLKFPSRTMDQSQAMGVIFVVF